MYMYHEYLSFDLLNFSLIHKSYDSKKSAYILRRITIIYLYVWEFILCSICLKVLYHKKCRIHTSNSYVTDQQPIERDGDSIDWVGYRKFRSISCS